MNLRIAAYGLSLASAALPFLTAQEPSAPAPAAPASTAQDPTKVESSFDRAAGDAQKRLESSLQELTRLREQMKAENLPLSKRLSALESELTSVRQEHQKVTRELEERALELKNLSDDIKSYENQASHLGTLVTDYLRNFESRLHIVELQRYDAELDRAKLARENTALGPDEVFSAQAQLVELSLERLNEGLGGTSFPGQAVDETGVVWKGRFTLVGPAAIFRSDDGTHIGTAEQKLGSLEPALMQFSRPEDTQAAGEVVSSSTGAMPLDPTLGNAHKIEATEETLWEHIKAGGNVMWPILLMAAAALIVILYKWVSFLFVRRPSQVRVRALLQAIARRDKEGALREAQAVGGPTGKMLTAGTAHLGEPRELIEEVMYETVLETKLRLNRFLPFVAVCASSAPLLGLLGTVTGIMTTFKLITVYGTGDVKTLSSGIAEALITTEYGLIVAIPSLLLHALLARKAKGLLDGMEKSAVEFLNQLSKVQLVAEPPPGGVPTEAELGDDPGFEFVPAMRQAREALRESQLEGAVGYRAVSPR